MTPTLVAPAASCTAAATRTTIATAVSVSHLNVLCTGGYPKDGRFRPRNGRRPRPLDRDSGAQRAGEALEGASGRDRRGDAPLNVEWEAIVVDDGSVDGTTALIEELARAQGRIRGVRLRRRFGKSAALAAGFDHAQGATIVTIDGDGQDDPADIPVLLDALGGGADLVSGWKPRPPRSTNPQSRLPALQLGDRRRFTGSPCTT